MNYPVVALRGTKVVAVPSNGRDFWAILALALGFVTAVTAIVAFVAWLLEQRRRPEVNFIWKFARGDSADDLEEWSHSKVQSVRVGETFLVEASVQNCGDASGERSLTNFVVNACVKLESYPRREDAAQPLDGQNGIAGFPPGLWTRWFARERTFYPAMCWQQRYLLTVESEPERGGIRLLMVLSDDRLNATGRRLLPSLISEDQWDDPAPYGDPWPGDREHRRRHVGRIRMKPRDEPIRAARGERKSVRDVEVISD